ncbi:Polyadenylate-binding protein 2 [Phytophthora palmivora]|uniref:Polyadenylate-binding protein 2 n=1 Tax=Phytophthora palmivora TaxID=4796 RepID=A0A2P4Y8G3_9STRA|nr:Polyadenylate-binding protein 2 [Phytophthora palmivora]
MADEAVDVSKLEAEAASLVGETEDPKTDGVTPATEESAEAVDAEIEDMKRRVKEMEEEAAKLSEMQSEVESQMGKNTASSLNEMGGTAAAAAQPAQMDDTSIYIGQVDYGSTPEELQALFQSCGTINRVTILCDKFTGQPKGYAYIEFASRDAVESALLLNDTMFRGRQLKVVDEEGDEDVVVARPVEDSVEAEDVAFTHN